MQLILALFLAAALTMPALAGQTPHRMEIQEVAISLARLYQQYGLVDAAWALKAPSDPSCITQGPKRCDATLAGALQGVAMLERQALSMAHRDFPDLGVTVATPSLTLGQLVEVLHANQGELRAILDRYARDGQ